MLNELLFLSRVSWYVTEGSRDCVVYEIFLAGKCRLHWSLFGTHTANDCGRWEEIGWLLTNASYRHVMLSKGPALQAFVSHFSSPLLLPICAVKVRAIATWGNLKQHGSKLINNKKSFKNNLMGSVDIVQVYQHFSVVIVTLQKMIMRLYRQFELVFISFASVFFCFYNIPLMI